MKSNSSTRKIVVKLVIALRVVEQSITSKHVHLPRSIQLAYKKSSQYLTHWYSIKCTLLDSLKVQNSLMLRA